MRLRIETDQLLAGLTAFELKSRACIANRGASAAKDWEDYAKQNRPWTDRTGNARRTLEGVAGWVHSDGSGSFAPAAPLTGLFSCDSFCVGVEGHMPYSVFLELGYGRKYSILSPTVHHFAPSVLLGFAACLCNMK